MTEIGLGTVRIDCQLTVKKNVAKNSLQLGSDQIKDCSSSHEKKYRANRTTSHRQKQNKKHGMSW